MMADRENAIKWIEWFLQDDPYVSDADTYMGFVGGLKDALALLKEQEAEISRISNAYLELVGKASKQPKVVLCKDCKHYRATPKYCAYDRIWQKNKGHIWGMYCEPDWFCADGERRCEE